MRTAVGEIPKRIFNIGILFLLTLTTLSLIGSRLIKVPDNITGYAIMSDINHFDLKKNSFSNYEDPFFFKKTNNLESCFNRKLFNSKNKNRFFEFDYVVNINLDSISAKKIQFKKLAYIRVSKNIKLNGEIHSIVKASYDKSYNCVILIRKQTGMKKRVVELPILVSVFIPISERSLFSFLIDSSVNK